MRSNHRTFTFWALFFFLILSVPKELYAYFPPDPHTLSRFEWWNLVNLNYAGIIINTLHNCHDAARRYMNAHSHDVLSPSPVNDIALITPYFRKPKRVYMPSFEPYPEGHRMASPDKYAFFITKEGITWVGRFLLLNDVQYNNERVLNNLHAYAEHNGRYYGSGNLETPPASTDSTLRFKPGDAVIWMQVK